MKEALISIMRQEQEALEARIAEERRRGQQRGESKGERAADHLSAAPPIFSAISWSKRTSRGERLTISSASGG